ncbi:plasminogen receptor (KT) isoform X2 [Struthio camelus]|uniref:plasminogen receptor (KT) isoform X2 n=1 Tax=Struthio camelus TaxID=8801 RepID=UPI00051E45F6|nr:PREDICTED: plasminogen receptor (KT) isoform X1 [Struthio camelus australis]
MKNLKCIEIQLERQLLMQNQMRERQAAMQIAWTREFLKYFGTFFGLAAVGLTAGAIKKKNPRLLLPIVPLSFIFAYQYDMGYGTMLQRMKGEAENILETQSTLLELPKGPLTYEGLEKIRRAQSKFSIEK